MAAGNPQGMNPLEQTAYGLFWAQIQAAAESHQSVADMWASIREQATQLGMESPGVNASAVMRLRGYASQIVAAGERLAATDPEFGLTGNMIAQAPWSRDLATQALSPMWQVRYQANGLDAEGNPTSSWLTAVFSGSLPETVGGLNDSIFGSATDTVATSDTNYENLSEVSDVSNIQIMAV